MVTVAGAAPSLLLKAVNYSGSGNWLDESGNGNDAAPQNTPTFNVDHWELTAASSHFFLVSDDATLDFSESESFTVVAVVTPDTVSGLAGIVSKENGSTGWMLYRSGDNQAFRIHDGTNVPTDEIFDNGLVAGTKVVLAGRRDVANDEVEVFYNTTGSGTPTTDSTTGTIANAVDLKIGSRTSASYFDGDFYGVALFREALTDKQIYLASLQLQAESDADPTTLHGDALMSWILANETLTNVDTELVGALNELNGTNGVEYAQARATYLGVDPAG